MLSIVIGSIAIIVTGYGLKKCYNDISILESEILSSSENNENDISSSDKAIKKL